MRYTRAHMDIHIAACINMYTYTCVHTHIHMRTYTHTLKLDSLYHYRIAGHHQLADRLIECQYELTDKLSNFISGRKPVHSIGEHYIVPQVGMR